ncbi:MAG: ribonuclease HIII [Ignavibacteriae bacterium HGW-Ignavibacteriae-3]|nr:MAG: ribonuclease HIII [Ignavibacteriae bacterium HGW-Ignavibacteriae-3]
MTLETNAEKHIYHLQKRTIDAGMFVSNPVKKEYNYEFTAEKNKQKVKIQVYFGKKGIKTVLQGEINSELHKTLSELILDQPKLVFPESKINEPKEYIGTDECGKGDFFGPLVVAAVFVDKNTKKLLSDIGVRDSKDLGDQQIKFLAGKIKTLIEGNYQIVGINPARYNELYAKFLNLNKLLNWAHSKAIDNLLDNTECKFVITDKFSRKELDVSTFSKHSDVEFVLETKAEKYIGVAAASIIARDRFVRWFEDHQRGGLSLPKGSSIETEKFAKNLLKKIGEDSLGELAKLHFKTFKKINSG